MEQTFPVVRKLSSKAFEIVDLPVAEVNYCNIESGVLKYTAKDGQSYFQITTIEEQERYAERFNFRRVERGYIVNTENVAGFNEEKFHIFFEEPYNSKGQIVPVSQRYVAALRQEGVIPSKNHRRQGLSTSF